MLIARLLIGGLIVALPVGAAAAGASPRTAQSVDGKHQYEVYCASCHGTGGKGDGAFSKSLKTRPADLTQLAKKNKGQFPDAEVARLIDGRSLDQAHRKSDMPVWGDVFSKSQGSTGTAEVQARINALVRYLEKIQEKGTN